MFAGSQEAGSRIAGISEVEVSDVLAGSKGAPVVIGQRVLVTVRVAEGGCLLPRRENAGPKDPPAVSLLRIDSYPDVMFDVDGTSHVAWVAFARIIDVGTQRVIDTGRSGPTTEESAALAGRPHVRGVHERPRIPGRQHLLRGREQGGSGPSSDVADRSGEGVPPEPEEGGGRGSRCAVVGLGVVGVALASSGDDEPSAQGPAVTGSVSPTASPTTPPSPSPTVEVTTLSQESASFRAESSAAPPSSPPASAAGATSGRKLR